LRPNQGIAWPLLPKNKINFLPLRQWTNFFHFPFFSRRAGTSDEVANVAALLMGSEGAFITGSDVLMDGGVTASYFFGEVAPAPN